MGDQGSDQFVSSRGHGSTSCSYATDR